MTDHNPYATPSAPLKSVAPRRKGSPAKAILLGLLVDIGGTVLASIAFALGYGALLGAVGVPPAEIGARIAAGGPGTTVGLLLTAMGTVMSALGGYVCARTVRANELRVALVMAAISCSLGVLLGNEGDSLWYVLSLAMLGLGGIVCGAELGRRRNRRDEAGVAG